MTMNNISTFFAVLNDKEAIIEDIEILADHFQEYTYSTVIFLLTPKLEKYKSRIIREIGDGIEIEVLELGQIQSYIDDCIMDEEYFVVTSNVDSDYLECDYTEITEL